MSEIVLYEQKCKSAGNAGKSDAKREGAGHRATHIGWENDAHEFADFHALRHTFITNLANSGVHPKVAMDLARHSDIRLTMLYYTHMALEKLSEAVELLPEIAVEAAAVKTGTDEESVLASCLAFQAGFRGTNIDSVRQDTRQDNASAAAVKSNGDKGKAESSRTSKKSHLWDLNPGPALYESAALPLS